MCFYCPKGLALPMGPCSPGFYCTGGATGARPTDGETGNICPPGTYCGEPGFTAMEWLYQPNSPFKAYLQTNEINVLKYRCSTNLMQYIKLTLCESVWQRHSIYRY